MSTYVRYAEKFHPDRTERDRSRTERNAQDDAAFCKNGMARLNYLSEQLAYASFNGNWSTEKRMCVAQCITRKALEYGMSGNEVSGQISTSKVNPCTRMKPRCPALSRKGQLRRVHQSHGRAGSGDERVAGPLRGG